MYMYMYVCMAIPKYACAFLCISVRVYMCMYMPM